jgi:hypothetical protein
MTPLAYALFSLWSKILRLQAEMPYSCTTLVREKSNQSGFYEEFILDFYWRIRAKLFSLAY